MHSLFKSFALKCNNQHNMLLFGRLRKDKSCMLLGLIIGFVVGILLLPACQSAEMKSENQPFIDFDEVFVESNKYLIQLEEEAIDDFIDRYGWDMQKTGSGLRYMIQHEGTGKHASYGNRAEIGYRMYLITGEPVYSSDTHGSRAFTVGRGGVESGLEEGILLMREGAQATFIMPHYLAHGVPGDGNKIPRRATVIYRVELLNLN